MWMLNRRGPSIELWGTPQRFLDAQMCNRLAQIWCGRNPDGDTSQQFLRPEVWNMIYKMQKSWQLSNFLDFVSKEGGKLHGVNFRSDRHRRVHQHQIKQLHCLCFGDDVREGLPRVSQLKMIKCNLSSQESEDTWRVVFGHLHLFLLIFTSVAFFSSWCFLKNFYFRHETTAPSWWNWHQ